MSDQQQDDLEVLVGRIGKPHGIRGEVTLDVRTDEPDRRFAPGTTIRAQAPAGADRRPSTLTVNRARWHQGTLLVTFEELTDRTAAEAVRGTLLHATLARDAVPEDPDEYYDHQLIGLAVVDLDGTPLGEVTALVHGSAQDLLTVRTPDGRDTLVPFVAALVPEVDLAAGRVIVADRPGLVSPFPEDVAEDADPLVRIDVVSIFPDYLAPLDLSLPGKARDKGLLDLAVHDLRDWTTDRHRTVDDTPYGGGAGMVMKPQPWGHALDDVAHGATIIFTTPSGEPFTQEIAQELSTHAHLVFACGRYEGIDQRVIEHAATLGTVRELSLGDYVLNGGEVAALAITEAVVRLLPGFMGNAASLVEESHADGLLEYPVYTKPASWQGRDVPDVLLSGDHARIAAWRREQAERRTAERRPDLLPRSGTVQGLSDLDVRPAVPADAGEIYTLQRACWLQELVANPGVEIPALRESLDDVRRWLGEWTVMVAREPASGRLVGGVRGRLDVHGEWDIGRIMVAPDLQGRGLGRALLELVESLAPRAVRTYVLFTGAGSTQNLRMYKKAGFRLRPDRTAPPGAVVLTKRISR